MRSGLRRGVGLVVLLTALAPPAPILAAAPGLVLHSGQLDFVEYFLPSTHAALRGLRIELTGNETPRGAEGFSGTASDRAALMTFTTSGRVSAVFNPDTNVLRGELQIDELSAFHRETKHTVTHYETLRTHTGTFQGQVKPGERDVDIRFQATTSQTVSGDYPKGWVEDEVNYTTTNTLTLTFQIEWTGVAIPSPVPTPPDVRVDSNARFSDLSGQVEVNIPLPDGTYDPENWTFAKLDQVLPYGTHIKTSDRSSVILSFGDMTTFMMKPECEIVLDPPGERDSQVQLLLGNLWVNVRKMAKDGSMDIEMSQAVAGIKGTVLVLQESAAGSTLQVLEGTVTLTHRATGETVTVEAGQTSTATEAGLSAPEPVDVVAVTADWAALEAGMAADTPSPSPSASPPAPSSAPRSPGPSPAPSATPLVSVLLEVSDRAGKLKSGAAEPTFRIDGPYRVTSIETFHWNGGRGAAPGKIRLLAEDGSVIGPWEATGRPGPGGVPDAYWVVEPDVVLPAGTYRVVDSDPATWTQSTWTKGLGYVEVRGHPAD